MPADRSQLLFEIARNTFAALITGAMRDGIAENDDAKWVVRSATLRMSGRMRFSDEERSGAEHRDCQTGRALHAR